MTHDSILLRRAAKHLAAWWAWYGKVSDRYLPLPPAGGVELLEDIDDSLARATTTAQQPPQEQQ